MLFVLGLLAATWTVPDPPESAQLLTDLAAVQSAKADTIALDVATCASAKIRQHRPTTEEVGNSASAADFLKRSLDECGYVLALAQVRSRLKDLGPTLTDQELDRQQSVAFAFPAIGLIIATNAVFHIEASAAPDSAVQVPRPSMPSDGRD